MQPSINKGGWVVINFGDTLFKCWQKQVPVITSLLCVHSISDTCPVQLAQAVLNNLCIKKYKTLV